MGKEEGYKIIRTFYENFKDYFKEGKIIVGGSYYYGKLGHPSTYHDVDFIIDGERKYDYIVKQLYDYYLRDGLGSIHHFRENLQAGLEIGETHVDLLRNDFSDNLPPFEIIPGVWTYRQSNERLVKVYEDFIESAKTYTSNREYYDERIKKFTDLRDFFKSS